MYGEGQDLVINDVNAAVSGLVDAKVDQIVVWDNHHMSFNQLLPRLHPAAQYMRGSGPNNTRWPILDASVNGLILLGYHAKAGTLHAVLEHTMSSLSWFRFSVNGRQCGELGIDAAMAGAVGVPVIMASGDDKLCAEATDFLGPDVVTVCVKQGLARHGAICLSPEESGRRIAHGAREAVGRIGKVKPLDLGSPAEIELVYKQTSQADEADLRMFNGRRVDGYTVRWTAPDLPTWMGFTAAKPAPRG
jgi:D-amino peptidase